MNEVENNYLIEIKNFICYVKLYRVYLNINEKKWKEKYKYFEVS